MMDIELKDTQYTGYPTLDWRPIVASMDEQTELVAGIRSGEVNHMRVGEATNDKALIQFLHYTKVTDNHVDQAEVVGEATMALADLQNFHKLISDYLTKHS